jgi:hypothetical protein
MKSLILSVTIAVLVLGFRSSAQTQTPAVQKWRKVPAASNSQNLVQERLDLKLRKSQAASGPDNTYCGKGNVPKFGSNDGPAQLPRACIYTARDSTPSPGKIIPVNSGGNASEAIARANCGDIVELQAGGTYTGLTSIPAKACDDQRWITVRTSGWRNLPPEGVRVTPCYAGVASLRGRPAYACPHPENVMAKVLVTTIGGQVRFAPAANHYRFIGIEFTREAHIGPVNELADVDTSTKIIFDQTWFHGNDDSNGDETKRGVYLAHSYLVSVIDSYFNDFYCIAVVGTCTDAQAINGGYGTPPGNWGGYKIVNNFLEAAGENIIFGGDEATASAADIEIRRNHLFKPFTWMPGSSSYDGGAPVPSVQGGHTAIGLVKALLGHTQGAQTKPGEHYPLMVKNLFELKNASRVLLEGNILENVWGGFSQNGAAILLNPQEFSNCHICGVSDVTIRYDIIRRVGRPFEIADIYRSPGHNYSIHDVVADGLQYLPGCYGSSCSPYFNEIMTSVSVAGLDRVLHDLKIDHITEVLINYRGTSLMSVSGPVGPFQMYNFTIQNSIIPAGEYGIMNGEGGCAEKPGTSVPKLEACFRNLVFTNNAIPYAATGAGGDWGKGNFLLSDQNAVGFVGIDDLDFHLSRSSRYKKRGTDGNDLGADIDALNSATAGVE